MFLSCLDVLIKLLHLGLEQVLATLVPAFHSVGKIVHACIAAITTLPARQECQGAQASEQSNQILTAGFGGSELTNFSFSELRVLQKIAIRFCIVFANLCFSSSKEATHNFMFT